MGSCLGWLQVHKINGLKICKSKELRVCCTHSPQTQAKKCLFSWLSFVDVKRSLCTTHNWWQRNEQRPKNERSKVFLHFQADASCILTWTSKLWARNNPNQPLPLGCKLQPSGKARSNLQTAAPGSKQHGLIRTKIECVQLLRVMAEGKGATKR